MAHQPEDLTAEGLCNQALVHLGARGSFLTDMDADGTEEAEIFSAIYDHVLAGCLAAFPWPFATLRATLASLDPAVEPARDGWQHVFSLPPGCIAPRKIWPVGSTPTLADLYGTPVSTMSLRVPRSDQRIPFGIEKSSRDDSSVLLCDLAQPVLFYTVEMNDPTKYPPLFQDALGWMLAAESAQSITGKESKEDRCLKEAVAAIHAAQVAAMEGQQEDQPPETESIAARW